MGRQFGRFSRAFRRKSKRMITISAAALAALAVGGTAAFAFSDLGTKTGPVSGADLVPEAEISRPQTPAAASPPQLREQAQAQRDEVVEQAALSAQARTTQDEEPESEPGRESGGQDGSEPIPTGEGGACRASMYGDPQPTASGESFDPSSLTAAHKTLPLHTMVRVTNPANGKSVTVRINDRGPFISGRCLDLSTASFSAIAAPSQGVVQVEWQVVE